MPGASFPLGAWAEGAWPDPASRNQDPRDTSGTSNEAEQTTTADEWNRRAAGQNPPHCASRTYRL